MKKILALCSAAAALAAFPSIGSSAQGVAVDTPVGGARIGEPGYHRYHHDYDGPVERERRYFEERDVGLRDSCKRVTIRNHDGSIKRIQKCN